MPVRDVIVIATAIASLPVCFLRPHFGIVVWTVIAFLNPHQQSWGPARSFPLAQLVAVATLAGTLLFVRDWRGLKTRETGLLTLLWIWFTITSIIASHSPGLSMHAADTWYKYEQVSKIFLMTVVTVVVINDWRKLRWLVLALAGSFAFFSLKATPWMVLTAGVFRLYGPEGTMLGDNNDFGLALNMTLPLLFFLARTEESSAMRKLMWITFACTIPSILFTYSRGALAGLTTVMTLMVMRLRQRFILLPVLVLVALFAVFLTPDHWRERMDFSKDGSVVDASARSRFNAWTYSWRLAMDYPITGGGFDAFTPELFYRYAPNPADVHGPHSIYFGVLAEHGFIGLGLYSLLVGTTFLSLRRIAGQARRAGDVQAMNYALMFQFSVTAFLVSGAFLGRAYFDYYFTIVACTAILNRLWQAELFVMETNAPEMSEVPA